jgi:hypothetical protein
MHDYSTVVETGLEDRSAPLSPTDGKYRVKGRRRGKDSAAPFLYPIAAGINDLGRFSRVCDMFRPLGGVFRLAE